MDIVYIEPFLSFKCGRQEHKIQRQVRAISQCMKKRGGISEETLNCIAVILMSERKQFPELELHYADGHLYVRIVRYKWVYNFNRWLYRNVPHHKEMISCTDWQAA